MADAMTAEWIVISVLSLLVIGVAILSFGYRWLQQSAWASRLSVLAVLLLFIFLWTHHGDWQFEPVIFSQAWIWPRDEKMSLVVGILQDPIGFTLAILASTQVLVILSSRQNIMAHPRPDRFYAAMAIALFGTVLSWVSSTAWLAFIGNAMTLLAGFLSFGGHWDSPMVSRLAARFLRERASGLLMAMIGAFILLSQGASLEWPITVPWSDTPYASVGAALYMLGLFLQFQSFPFTPSLVADESVPISVRVSLSQVFPALAASALLVRSMPALGESVILAIIGYIVLLIAMLTSLTGLFQRQWRNMLSVWVSAGFSLGFAALTLAGTWPGLVIIISVSLVATALALSGSALKAREPGAATTTGSRKSLAAKIICAMAILLATGFIGFASAGGILQWLSTADQSPYELIGVAGVLLLHMLLVWKCGWFLFRLPRSTTVSWLTVLPPWILIICGTGLALTGTFSGGALQGGVDFAFNAPFTGYAGDDSIDNELYLQAAAILASTWLFAFLLSYVMSGRKVDRWSKLADGAPKVTGFIAAGYRADRPFVATIRLLARIGSLAQKIVDRGAWDRWLPNALGGTVRAVSRSVARADFAVSSRLSAMIRTGTEAPGKLLQVVQSGDVQWYLFFAVGSIAAILLHFLRFAG